MQGRTAAQDRQWPRTQAVEDWTDSRGGEGQREEARVLLKSLVRLSGWPRTPRTETENTGVKAELVGSNWG